MPKQSIVLSALTGKGVIAGPRSESTERIAKKERDRLPSALLLAPPASAISGSSLGEAHHLLCGNPVHLNISSFGFTKPSESKDPSRRLVYLLRSPGGQFPRISPNGVF
jgi:hypothetical protein